MSSVRASFETRAELSTRALGRAEYRSKSLCGVVTGGALHYAGVAKLL